MSTVVGARNAHVALGKPDTAMLLPPAALLMPPDPRTGISLGMDAGSGQVLPEVAAQLARAGQAGRVISARLRASAIEHAPEMRRKAAVAAQAAGKGASAALVAAAGASGNAREAWAATGARPGLRRGLLLGGAALLAVVLGGGWLIAKQQAISSARREVPAALARLGLAGMVTYADVTASLSGSVTLERVTWRNGRQTIPIASITVGGLDQGPSGLRRGDLRVRGMAVPVSQSRDDLPPGLGNMLLGLGYVAPLTDIDASFDLNDARQTLLADVDASSAGLGSAEIHIQIAGATTGGLAPLVTAYSQKFGFQPDRRFSEAGMSAMQAALQSLTRLALLKGSITLDDAPLRARAALVPAQSMPDEAPSPDEQGQTQRFLAGLAKLAVPDNADAARQAAASWLKEGGRLVVSADPASPVPLFTAGDTMAPELSLDDPNTLAQANITIRR